MASSIKNNLALSANFADRVFVAAEQVGVAFLELVKLLKSGNIDWNADYSLTATAYKEGYICGYIRKRGKVIDRDATKVILGKLPPAKDASTDKLADKRRSALEQAAVAAAAQSWSEAAAQSGKPSQKGTTGPRGSKARKAAVKLLADGTPAPKAPTHVVPQGLREVAPKFKDPADILKARDLYVGEFAMLLSKNAGMKLGAFHDAIMQCIDILKAVKPE